MKRMPEATKLFLSFLKLGCFTFGGGWSIVAQMQRLYVEKEQVLTQEELVDLTSVARGLPGTMVGNVAVLFGYRVCGALGSVVCLLGMVLPPMALLAVVTFFYTVFRENAWVAAAMSGVRAAIVPIILSAAVGMVKGSFKLPPCVAVFVVTLALYLFLNLNCVYLILIGAVCGLLLSEFYERRENKRKREKR